MSNKKKYIGSDLFYHIYITCNDDGTKSVSGELTEFGKIELEHQRNRMNNMLSIGQQWIDNYERICEENEYKKPKTVFETIKQWLNL